MNQQNNILNLPVAIIMSAVIIAVAIVWVKNPIPKENPTANQDQKTIDISIRTINNSDHILGNPKAPILIVEYSDSACPFCKTFHVTMKSVMGKYGPLGQVAWIYRHFPLDKPDPQGRVLHPNAGIEAQAMECASELGGNTAFWKFTDRLYEVTPSDQGKPLDRTELPKIAQFAGLDIASFNSCIESERHAERVNADYLDGINAGMSGTPTSFFVLDKQIDQKTKDYISSTLIKYRIPEDFIRPSKDGKIIYMSGAMPEEIISGLIETLID